MAESSAASISATVSSLERGVDVQGSMHCSIKAGCNQALLGQVDRPDIDDERRVTGRTRKSACG